MLVAELNESGAKSAARRHLRRAWKLDIATAPHTGRRAIGTFFREPKTFKRPAIRVCQTDRGFEAAIRITAIVIEFR